MDILRQIAQVLSHTTLALRVFNADGIAVVAIDLGADDYNDIS